MKSSISSQNVPNTKPLRYVLRDSYEAKRLLLQRSSDWSLDWTNEHTQACYAYATECLKASILGYAFPAVVSSVRDDELVGAGVDAYFAQSSALPWHVAYWKHNDLCDDAFVSAVQAVLSARQSPLPESPVPVQINQMELAI
ncbi:MAG: hypothetical protein AB7E95_10105 [Kiritimatiellales bacterium]